MVENVLVERAGHAYEAPAASATSGWWSGWRIRRNLQVQFQATAKLTAIRALELQLVAPRLAQSPAVAELPGPAP